MIFYFPIDVTKRCKVTDTAVRSSITTKCADENKMMRQRNDKNRKSLVKIDNKENQALVETKAVLTPSNNNFAKWIWFFYSLTNVPIFGAHFNPWETVIWTFLFDTKTLANFTGKMIIMNIIGLTRYFNGNVCDCSYNTSNWIFFFNIYINPVPKPWNHHRTQKICCTKSKSNINSKIVE